jgi:coproporphyrinogen III oxidase-like Fe-S oxidoreductase
VRTPDRYIELVASEDSVESSAEELDPKRQRIEGLQLSLRTREGVPRSSLSEADIDLLDSLIVVSDDTITLTTEGRLLANEVAVRLR